MTFANVMSLYRKISPDIYFETDIDLVVSRHRFTSKRDERRFLWDWVSLEVNLFKITLISLSIFLDTKLSMSFLKFSIPFAKAKVHRLIP